MMLSKKKYTCIKQYGVYELLLSETTAKVTICNFILHVFFSLLHQFHSFNLFIRFSYFIKFLIKTIFLRGFLNIVLQFYYYDIYRISHRLRLDTIFIQRVGCFLSPSLGEGIGTNNELNENHILPKTIWDSFCNTYLTVVLLLLFYFKLSYRLYMSNNVLS